MLVDWFKQNMIATVTGAVLGTAVIGGSVVYIIQEKSTAQDSQPAPNSTNAQEEASTAPIPMKFSVEVAGTWQWIGPRSKEPAPRFGTARFFCDLTVNPQVMCESHSIADNIAPTVIIQRHAADHTRVSIRFGGVERTGITWQQLSAGVKIGMAKMTAHLAQPKRPS